MNTYAVIALVIISLPCLSNVIFRCVDFYRKGKEDNPIEIEKEEVVVDNKIDEKINEMQEKLISMEAKLFNPIYYPDFSKISHISKAETNVELNNHLNIDEFKENRMSTSAELKLSELWRQNK